MPLGVPNGTGDPLRKSLRIPWKAMSRVVRTHRKLKNSSPTVLEGHWEVFVEIPLTWDQQEEGKLPRFKLPDQQLLKRLLKVNAKKNPVEGPPLQRDGEPLWSKENTTAV